METFTFKYRVKKSYNEYFELSVELEQEIEKEDLKEIEKLVESIKKLAGKYLKGVSDEKQS